MHDINDVLKQKHIIELQRYNTTIISIAAMILPHLILFTNTFAMLTSIVTSYAINIVLMHLINS